MKRFNKVAMLFAIAALATTAGAQTVDNWRSGDSQLVWKNGTNEHCWRDANWTPATAAPGCDGAIAAATPLRPVVDNVAPAIAPAPIMPAPPSDNAPPLVNKITFAADAFFDFDKSVLKPEGKKQLDKLLGDIQGLSLEVIIAAGHTDSVGSDGYNQKLSVRRSESVKAYLVSKGVKNERVFTEGKGEAKPVADNKTAAGRAQNRRVEIEVVGTRRK